MSGQAGIRHDAGKQNHRRILGSPAHRQDHPTQNASTGSRQQDITGVLPGGETEAETGQFE